MSVSPMPNEVASLMISLGEINLLVPNSCVAEIVPISNIEKDEDSPEWLKGNINWRELALPCISFENLIGEEEDQAKKNDRIAIFNTLDESFNKRFYGLVVSGIPRLVRVVEQEIVEDEAVKNAFEKARAQLNGESCIIPNLEAIEKLLSTAQA